jgi:hypothetical protein
MKQRTKNFYISNEQFESLDYFQHRLQYFIDIIKIIALNERKDINYEDNFKLLTYDLATINEKIEELKVEIYCLEDQITGQKI